MLNLAILISGNGSNLQAIIDAINNRELNAKIEIVISNKENAYGLTRARNANINTSLCIKDNTHTSSEKIIDVLKNYKIDLVVLAGYLGILSKELIQKYPNKIINIHPSLLPKYGGKGMYGIHVHEAVINNKEKESGCTVHFVNEKIDDGKIILQTKVPVFQNDSPKTLAERILPYEHKTLVDAIEKFAKKKKNSILNAC
jgi:phosphoribosylglycinamide formyltransferase-1